jgi:hypothetical protein
MISFPDPSNRVAGVSQRLAAQFASAERFFSAWLPLQLGDRLRASELPDTTKSVVWMLNTQACRQFRTTIELARIAEASNGSIIARSLFESALALRFVLAAEFMVRIEQKRDRDTGQPLPNKWNVKLPNHSEDDIDLPRDLRAQLYAAQCFRKGAQIAEICGNRSPVDPRIAGLVVERIGPQWDSIQRSGKSYSGMSVEVLAQASGSPFPLWYEKVYRDQSRRVHGIDAFSHVVGGDSGDPKPAWLSTDDDVEFVLYCAMMLFLICTNLIADCVPLDAEADGAVEEFFRELKIVWPGQISDMDTRG